MTLTEVKEFVNLLKSKDIQIFRTKGNTGNVSLSSFPHKSIVISNKAEQPIHTLFHEGGHQLTDTLYKLYAKKKSGVDLDIIREELANKAALDYIKTDESRKLYKEYADKHLKLWK